jgi:transcriptional regulator with XRE-family HTH domain
MDNVELGKRIKDLRKSRNLKQDDLAAILEISRGQISNLENGRRSLNLTQLEKLCSLFKVDMSYFGIEPDTQETIQLLERAKLLFESDIPDSEKEELYSQIMKLYLKFKGTI